jgi:spermidine/putrescine transport system substrate-binding protein
VPAVRFLGWPGMPAERPLAEAARRATVKVQLEIVSSNEAIEERLREGCVYDVVCPSDYMVERLRSAGMLSPLDAEQLRGRARLSPLFSDPPWDPGLKNSTPLAFGTTGILFRRSDVPDADSWMTLFDPPAHHTVGMLSEVREVLGAALLATGHGINETTAEALADAGAVLEAQAPRVLAYTSDDFVSAVVTGPGGGTPRMERTCGAGRPSRPWIGILATARRRLPMDNDRRGAGERARSGRSASTH